MRKTFLTLAITTIALMLSCSKSDDTNNCQCESVRGYQFENCGEFFGDLEKMSDNALELAQDRNPCD